MKTKDIQLNHTYYFNNRPVKVLRLEGDNFAFVEAVLDITHDVTGSCFCEPCNISSYSSHKCHDAQEIIDYVLEDISDVEVFWVNIAYLRETYFEHQDNLKLKSENDKFQKQVKDAKEEITRLKKNESTLLKSVADLQKSFNTQIAAKEKLRQDIQQLKEKKDKVNEDIRLNRSVTIKGTPIVIKADDYLDLLQDSIKLNALEAGGVDNWEWYGEALEDIDVKKEAFEQFVNLK